MRYSKENDVILDQFVGGGTTAVEAKLTNRNFIGIDINPNAIDIAKEKCGFEFETNCISTLKVGDARKLFSIKDSSIDLICTHPPYANIINYSSEIQGDLSLLAIKDFLYQMGGVAEECYRVLKKDCFCAILMGDIRKNGMVQPLAFETMRIFELVGFKIKEIILKEQHNCSTTDYWKTNSIKYNFLLLAHEYLFVLKK